MDSGDSARPCPKRAEREGFLAIAAKTIAGVGRFKRVWTTTTLHHTTLHLQLHLQLQHLLQLLQLQL